MASHSPVDPVLKEYMYLNMGSTISTLTHQIILVYKMEYLLVSNYLLALSVLIILG